jgi:hypothetical protein
LADERINDKFIGYTTETAAGTDALAPMPFPTIKVPDDFDYEKFMLEWSDNTEKDLVGTSLQMSIPEPEPCCGWMARFSKLTPEQLEKLNVLLGLL